MKNYKGMQDLWLNKIRMLLAFDVNPPVSHLGSETVSESHNKRW